MADEPFYAPNRKPPSARVAQPGERLFEFLRGDDRFLCELRDHGPYGAEAQFFQNEEFLFSRNFDPRLDPTRPARELAVQWANAERKAIQRHENTG